MQLVIIKTLEFYVKEIKEKIFPNSVNVLIITENIQIPYLMIVS